MRPHVWIIGGTTAGLMTAIRLLPYGFRLHILERATPAKIADQLDLSPPIWPGFFHATWSFLQEFPLPSLLPSMHSGSVTFFSPEGIPHSFPRTPLAPRLHLIPELLFFSELAWRDRFHLLNFLEKNWEIGTSHEVTPDIQTVEAWVTAAGQSETARNTVWGPLCRWLLGCDLSEASLRLFLAILTRYRQATTRGRQWFFGTSSSPGELTAMMRKWLTKQGVQFHICENYPLFQYNGAKQETLSLSGRAFSSSSAYVAALSPSDILSLLPERALTKFSQFDQMAHIPSRSGTLLTFQCPNIQLPPAIILGSQFIDWLAILPSETSDTTLMSLLQDHQDLPPLETHIQIARTRALLHKIFPLSSDSLLSLDHQSIMPQRLRLFPATAGSRAFRPQTNSPISNLFLVGPWIASSLPPSMETLINSINACAEAIANRFFAGLR